MKCRACAGPAGAVFDLGQHYLPDFISPVAKWPASKKWPLKMVKCSTCHLLQLEKTTPRELLYHDRYGFKSGVNEAIRADLNDITGYALRHRQQASSWLDIASNDGTLLSYVPSTIYRVGIDPLKQFADEARTHANEIIPDYFSPKLLGHMLFDVVTSVSVFYDLEDPGEFVRGVRDVLGRDGVWVIQQNYAADMITSNAIDNVCHEHITYFSVFPLQWLLLANGMEINDVAYSPVNGGCVRTLVSHRGRYPVNDSVELALQKERQLGLHHPATYERWFRDVQRELTLTRRLIVRATSMGERVYIYGASTRGGTILQMMQADRSVLPYAVDRNPAKVGKIMAQVNVPIISEEKMRADHPEYLLVGPWFFKDVFLRREREYLQQGGQMVFPLPHFHVVG